MSMYRFLIAYLLLIGSFTLLAQEHQDPIEKPKSLLSKVFFEGPETLYSEDPYLRGIEKSIVYNPWLQSALRPSQMAQGGVGLIQIPTSRMMPEGTLSASYSDNEEYRFWSVNLQLFDWMQATVRYSDVRTRLYSQFDNFSNDQTLKDKGIDAKFRLFKESKYTPEVSLGIRDFGGTGFFNSEFIGLSKRFGPLDTHINFNWGYLGSHDDLTNPFCSIRESYCSRDNAFTGSGGTIDAQRFFKGPMAVSFGLSYQTPWEPLILNLEYEGNNYQDDRAGALLQDSRWNAEAVYRYKGFDLSLNYQRGNTLGFGLTYNIDLNTVSSPKINAQPRDIEFESKVADRTSINSDRLTQDLLFKAGFFFRTSYFDGNVMTIYGTQTSYRDPFESTERIARILASELPDNITEYRIVELAGGIPMLETVVDAVLLKKVATGRALRLEIKDAFSRQPVSDKSIANMTIKKTSGWIRNIETFWIQTFGSPERFFMFQGGVALTGGYAFNEHHRISGTAKVTLVENFDEFNFLSDSQDTPLPRVRTEVRRYVNRADVTLDTLFYQYVDRPKQDLFVQAYAGYLETMFGGVGGEILYRPVDSNWSIGADLNYVRQRGFDDDVSFLDYSTFTGHINVYYRPEFLPNTRIGLNIGQFLAKDKGVKIDFSKRFDSGMVVGAFAAFTNVSAEEYGEGSFTKGFYLTIPLDLFTLQPSKGAGKIPWIPIGRDGGQTLNRPMIMQEFTGLRDSMF